MTLCGLYCLKIFKILFYVLSVHFVLVVFPFLSYSFNIQAAFLNMP